MVQFFSEKVNDYFKEKSFAEEDLAEYILLEYFSDGSQ